MSKLESPGIEFVDTTDIKPLRRYNVVELFAGAGGLALGLEQAGFKSIALNEIHSDSCKTLKKNRPEWNVIEADVIDVAKKGFKKALNIKEEVDLLSGGIPCQSFSYAGKGLGFADIRGTMFHYYAKALKQLKPKVFLLENVRGLTSHDNGRTFMTMMNIFHDIGYRIVWKVLNSNDYGVAQKRERVIVIGIREDIDKHVTHKYPLPQQYRPVLQDVLKNVPDSPGVTYSTARAKVLDLVPPGGYWKDLPKSIAKQYMGKSYYNSGGKTGVARRLDWHKPSLTLMCSPIQKQTERCHPSETRPLTTREYARIQGFPDTWEFEGGVGSIYSQIGNAVPVPLAKEVGLSLINTFNEIEQSI